MPQDSRLYIKPGEGIKSCIGNAVLTSVIFFFLHSVASGQHWNQVTDPNSSIFDTPYFLNENTGFVFNSDGLFAPHLQRTTDGGISWTALPFFDNKNLSLSQLYFTDINHGYAAGSDGVYETGDMGNTWHRIYNGAIAFTSVYAFGNKVFAFGGSPIIPNGVNWGPLIQSSDDGNSWDTVLVQVSNLNISFPKIPTPYVFGNNDSMVYAESIDTSQNMSLVYSTDNGKNWSSNPLDNFSNSLTRGFFAFPHCKDILRTVLFVNDASNADNYFVMHSSDFGANWNTLFVPFEIGAWIAGNNCVLYVCDAKGAQDSSANIRNGLWRSQDRGMNWSYINGPNFTEIDDKDFRNLSVVGNGAVVYADDADHKFWKTIDGGDGTLTPAGIPSSVSIVHDLSSAATICDTSLLRIFIESLSCNLTSLKNLKINGLDSTQFNTVWKHHLACDGIPDTILVQIFGVPAGVNTYNVNMHFVNDEFQTIDTSFDFTLSPKFLSTSIAITQNLTPAAFACDTSQLLMTFQSLSCFFTTLKSFKIDGLDSSQFSDIFKHHNAVDSLRDSLLLRIFSVPSGGGSYTIHLHFANDHSQSIDTSFVFTLSPLGVPTINFYVPSASLFGKAGDTIGTPLMVKSLQNITGLNSVDLTYSLNTDLLTPFAFIPINKVTAGPLKVTSTNAAVSLYFDSTFSFNGITELGKLRSVAYVTDTLETDIVLTGATHSSGCLTTLADSNISQFTLIGCGNTALSHFIEYGIAYAITSIIPNPARNSVQIRLKNDGRLLHFQLFDALGAIQRSGTTTGNMVQLDLSELSSGNYYFRISDESGIPVTSQFVIAR